MMSILRWSLATALFLLSRTEAFVPVAPASRLASSSSSSLQVAIDTSDIKNGLTVELDGEPYKVLNFSIMKQARGAAKTTIKFKNLMKGTTIENTYRSGEKFETAQIDKVAAQYTYNEGETFFFMNSETFEEIPVSAKVIDDKAKWMMEGSEQTLILFKGSVIEVVVPSPTTFEILETEPNVKGNTAQGYTKPATVANGAVIQVPGFIDVGQTVRVDTDKGEYLDRVSS